MIFTSSKLWIAESLYHQFLSATILDRQKAMAYEKNLMLLIDATLYIMIYERSH